MAAIIDWHSKAVLSHRISNTMDSQLVMSVLNDALEKHPHPEIFIKTLVMAHSTSILSGICKYYYDKVCQNIVQKLPFPSTNKGNVQVIDNVT
jgi:transposase InsO family protein